MEQTCRRGHPLSGPNLYVHPRTAQTACRRCRADATKRYYKRNPPPKKPQGTWHGLTAKDRFFKNVDGGEGLDKEQCWPWCGRSVVRGPDGKPYGIISYMGKQTTAIRVAYQLFRGRIPDGYECDHRCRNTVCVNPWHLEPVPHKINCLRGRQGAYLRERMACPKGHPYDEANTYWITDGAGNQRRDCRSCGRERKAAYKQRKKAENQGERMAIAVDMKTVIRHVLERDRVLPADQQTTFLLGIVPARDKAQLADKILARHEGGFIELRQETVNLGMLRAGLRGWENFKDRAGNVLEFKTLSGGNGHAVPTDEMLDLIRDADRTELVSVITKATELSEDDQKN